MKRIGVFTGTIYSEEDYNNNIIKECIICIDPALPLEEGIEKARERQRIRKIMTCPDCKDCLESMKADSRSKQAI